MARSHIKGVRTTYHLTRGVGIKRKGTFTNSNIKASRIKTATNRRNRRPDLFIKQEVNRSNLRRRAVRLNFKRIRHTLLLGQILNNSRRRQLKRNSALPTSNHNALNRNLGRNKLNFNVQAISLIRRCRVNIGQTSLHNRLLQHGVRSLHTRRVK